MWLSFGKENREKPLSFLCKTRSRKECFHIQSTRHTPLRRRRKKSFGVVVPPPRLPCLSNTFGGAVCPSEKLFFLYCPSICRFFFVKTASCIIFLHTLPIFDTSSNKNTKNFFISNYHGTFFEEP